MTPHDDLALAALQRDIATYRLMLFEMYQATVQATMRCAAIERERDIALADLARQQQAVAEMQP